MEKSKMGKVFLGLLCVAALGSAAGCGNKSDSDAKTPQEMKAFKGHQPTPAELQAAMSKMTPSPPPQGQPNTPK